MGFSIINRDNWESNYVRGEILIHLNTIIDVSKARYSQTGYVFRAFFFTNGFNNVVVNIFVID